MAPAWLHIPAAVQPGHKQPHRLTGNTETFGVKELGVNHRGQSIREVWKHENLIHGVHHEGLGDYASVGA